MPEYKQVKIASETLYIYAPLAHRIGLYNVKNELEDLSLKYTEPERYNSIKEKAAQVYYSQNRMITAEDYQVVPLSASQEIVKVRSVNRSASGISRAKEILDPTEVIRLYHPNGQCSEETVYRNGIKHGVFREFNTSGEIVSGGVYSDGVLLESGITDKSGKKQGKWIVYYKSGEVKAEGNYVDDLREGEWIFYYESGPVEQRGFYKKGEYDDVWVWSFKNGDKKRFEQYINGVEHGDFLEYDSLGNVLLKGNYKNGLREWNWIYHVNDHKEEGFYISGQKDGEWVHTYSCLLYTSDAADE